MRSEEIRLRAAIAVLPECVRTCNEVVTRGGKLSEGTLAKQAAMMAVAYADALAEKLKVDEQETESKFNAEKIVKVLKEQVGFDPEIHKIIDEHFDEMLGEEPVNLSNLEQNGKECKPANLSKSSKDLQELTESKDERIRKALLDAMNDYTPDSVIWDDIKAEEITAWLKKQGDYANFRDKAQVGDRITKNEAGVLVNLSQLKRVAKPAEQELSEDDKIRKEIVGFLDMFLGTHITPTATPKQLKEWIAWLEKQKHVEWNEEDEHRIEDIIYYLDTAKKHYASTVGLDACIDWLKSLRPQNHWKPSDEQMEELEEVIESNCFHTLILQELLEQLKKL